MIFMAPHRMAFSSAQFFSSLCPSSDPVLLDPSITMMMMQESVIHISFANLLKSRQCSYIVYGALLEQSNKYCTVLGSALVNTNYL